MKHQWRFSQKAVLNTLNIARWSVNTQLSWQGLACANELHESKHHHSDFISETPSGHFSSKWHDDSQAVYCPFTIISHINNHGSKYVGVLIHPDEKQYRQLIHYLMYSMFFHSSFGLFVQSDSYENTCELRQALSARKQIKNTIFLKSNRCHVSKERTLFLNADMLEIDFEKLYYSGTYKKKVVLDAVKLSDHTAWQT
jgi:hypothetical protein